MTILRNIEVVQKDVGRHRQGRDVVICLFSLPVLRILFGLFLVI